MLEGIDHQDNTGVIEDNIIDLQDDYYDHDFTDAAPSFAIENECNYDDYDDSISDIKSDNRISISNSEGDDNDSDDSDVFMRRNLTIECNVDDGNSFEKNVGVAFNEDQQENSGVEIYWNVPEPSCLSAN